MTVNVQRHYTTDQAYRAVRSNHIMAVRYDEDSMELFMDFYNGARYVHYGVPKGHYKGMMASASHGTYYWANIRHVYDCDMLDVGDTSKQKKEKPQSSNLSAELIKLDKLDEEEKLLNKQFKKDLVDVEQYEALLRVIQTKRDRLCTKLEKLGYFEDETVEVVEQGDDKENLFVLLFRSTLAMFGLLFKGITIIFAVFFGLLAVLS